MGKPEEQSLGRYELMFMDKGQAQRLMELARESLHLAGWNLACREDLHQTIKDEAEAGYDRYIIYPYKSDFSAYRALQDKKCYNGFAKRLQELGFSVSMTNSYKSKDDTRILIKWG